MLRPLRALEASAEGRGLEVWLTGKAGPNHLDEQTLKGPAEDTGQAEERVLQKP